MATKKAKQKEAQKLVAIYLGGKAAMKICIDGMEEALTKLLEIAKPGQLFLIGGVTYTLTDNFAVKNTAFKPTAFRRFDLKPVK